MSSQNSSFIAACESLFREADIPYDFSEWHKRTHGRNYSYPEPVYADNKDTVYAYWKRRCISPETIDELDIQQDQDGNTLFQYYDMNDVLVDVKVRISRPFNKAKEPRKCWHLTKGEKVNVLYNMTRVVPGQSLLITCGEGDCATAVECGFKNTVSINGGDHNTHWIGECWDWLEQFQEIILIHDNDESGRKFVKEVSKRLGEYRVKIAEIPLSVTAKDGKELEINDLNELLYFCGKQAVIDVINDAKDAEIPTVVDYTDVKRFDMSDVEGFITGLGDLDDTLTKFYMGSTTILTGSPGSGKTSFLSTLICQSVQQDFPVFVYSGELSNPSLKSWIDFCHAGRYGIQEYQKPSGSGVYYKVKTSAFDKINREYKGEILFYKDTLEQKASDLLQTAESVVRKFGVKTLIFDNMTSVDLENTDENKWQKQEEFIRNVIAFSTRWDVCCIVVLHPKKMDSNRRMSLYDLSGVSASVNLSHRVLSLYRVTPKEKQGIQKKGGDQGWITKPIDFDVIIDVLKDRFGSGAGRSVGLFYDIPSKRFYDLSENSLFFQYRWDDADHTGELYVGGPTTPESIREEENREVFGLID